MLYAVYFIQMVRKLITLILPWWRYCLHRIKESLHSNGQLVVKSPVRCIAPVTVLLALWHILSCLNVDVAYLNNLLLGSFYRRTCIMVCLVYLNLLQEISPAVFKIHSSSIYSRVLIFKEKKTKILGV